MRELRPQYVFSGDFELVDASVKNKPDEKYYTNNG
jgi:hypothetical protein